jgi:hypothetical protein
MKINKLNESISLVEADEASVIDPRAGSVADLADAINDEITTLSDGERELSDETATEVAQITKDIALKVDAGQVAFTIDEADYDDAKIENRLTKALDRAYRTAKMNFKDGAKNGANILVEGLPGAGKTAIVESWCAEKGLVLVALNATDAKLDQALNGIPLRDITQAEANAIAYAYAKEKFAPLLDPTNEAKCVLFVDEFNRQKTVQLRRPFMSIFNEKRNAEGTLDFRKTLLFSVICINPFGPQFHDQGVGELYPAETNRFLIKKTGAQGLDSTAEEAIKYWKGSTTNTLLNMGIISPGSAASKNHGGYVGPTRDLTSDELERAQRLVRVYTLAMQILGHPEFSFSTRDDAEDIYRQKADYVTSRMLSDALAYSQGNVKDFLEWVDEDSNFTTEAVEMFHHILDHYIMDTTALYKRYGLVPNANGGVEAPTASGTGTASTSAAGEDATDVEEDDELLFGAPSNANKQPVKSAAATEQEINNILDAWF